MNFTELKLSIDFEEFLISNGYRLNRNKSTRRNPVYSNGNESIVISNLGNIKLYFKPNADRGSIIDFCLNRPELLQSYDGSNMQKVNALLHDFLHIPQHICLENESIISKPTKFELTSDLYTPCKVKKAEDFLCLNKRGVQMSTLNSEVFENIGLSHFQKLNITNIAFPLQDENYVIRGLNLRNFKFKKLAEGSQKNIAVWLSNNKSFIENIILTESEIDSLSHYQLYYHSRLKDVLYISTCGSLTAGQINTILKIINDKKTINPNLRVINGFDNDLAGTLYTVRILLSLFENNTVSPFYINGDLRSFNNLNNAELKKHITNSKFQDIQITENKNLTYNIQFKYQKEVLRQLAQYVLKKMPYAELHIPRAKDWNEDDLNRRQQYKETQNKSIKHLKI